MDVVSGNRQSTAVELRQVRLECRCAESLAHRQCVDVVAGDRNVVPSLELKRIAFTGRRVMDLVVTDGDVSAGQVWFLH